MRARFPRHRRPTEWNVLLLVLILVLIAFGLLVVAVLSGSVLWAWVSVGVSVAAAAVLLVDWLQRRSAVKAGGAQTHAAMPMRGPIAGPPAADLEPATEVIPKVPTLPPDARPADGGDSAETVALPAVEPSGSPGGPSGATARITPPGPDSSRSVTEPGEGHTSGSPVVDDAAAAPADAAGQQDTAERSGAEPTAATPVDQTALLAGHGAGATEPDGSATANTREDSTSHEEPAAAPDAPGAGSAPDAEASVGADHGAVAPEAEPGSAAQQDADAQAALPPLGPDGAPPEEPRDPNAASVVAGLEDEVLVIDELPRYHVFGCRSLLGRPVIPLPAREAVELGFTPCGWCTPDRTLSTRYHAGAH